jgi:hypothetical protein
VAFEIAAGSVTRLTTEGSLREKGGRDLEGWLGRVEMSELPVEVP